MKYLTCYLLLGQALCLHAQDCGSSPVSPTFSSNLPLVMVTTNGQTIYDSVKITADLKIVWNTAARNQYTDPPNNYNGKIGIEFRGNSSQGFSPCKRSYGFETRDVAGNDLTVSLLGMPAEEDWILFGPSDDESFMRDVLTHQWYADYGRYYAPRCRFVELILNGDYRGIYVLMEKIKRDANRLAISKLDPDDTTGTALTGGYIIKIDHHNGTIGAIWNSPFPTECNLLRTDFELEYPKIEDLQPQQLAYIQHYMQQFESALAGPDFKSTVSGYGAYAETASFIDYFLISEMVRSPDAFSQSVFLSKKRAGKLQMGPTWDYNAALGNTPWNWCRANDSTGWQHQSNRLCLDDRKQPFWWKRLLEDSSFARQTARRWAVLRSRIYQESRQTARIDSIVTLLSEAQPRDYARWNVIGDRGSFPNEIAYLKTWLQRRLLWMDRHVPRLGGYLQTSSGYLSLCPGGTTLYAYTGHPDYLSYQWLRNAVPVGSNTAQYTATDLAAYSVTVSLSGCYQSTLPVVMTTAEVYSVRTGNWEDPESWSCRQVPQSSQGVSINKGHTISVTTPAATAGKLTVWGVLTLNPASQLKVN